MAAWCLPPKLANRMKGAIGTRELDPEKLMDVSSEERRTAFAQYVGEEHAHEVNTKFERKLLLKDQQAGIISWIKEMSGMKPKVARDFIARVSRMDKVFQPIDEQHFYQDLASATVRTDKMVTMEEAGKIRELAQKAMAARDAPTTNISGVSDEYLNASQEFRHYIDSLKPTTPVASIGKNAAIVGRNMLLANPATPIKTVENEIVNSTMDHFTRRLATGKVGGLNRDLVSAAKQEGWQTYLNTGANIASMENLDDFGRLGEQRSFDVKYGTDEAGRGTRAIETGVRTAAKWTNKVIIDWAHQAPFTKFYQGAFFDMNDLLSSKIAESEGLIGEAAKTRAADIFRDASRIQPLTDEGKIVRAAAQFQGARVTSTNATLMSRVAMNMKNALNHAVPGAGDILMPIAKIPANVIWNGVENAGVGLFPGFRDIFKGRALMQSADVATRYQGMAQFGQGLQRIFRVTGTLGGAAYLASLLMPNDFRQDRFGQSYVKIGGLWVNMEYISAISPALAGMMTMKQHEGQDQDLMQKFGHYTGGALALLKNAPGVNELESFLTALANPNYSKGIGKYLKDFIRSRTIPPVLWNLFQNRPMNRILFGAHGLESPLQVSEDEWPLGRLDLTPWGSPDANVAQQEDDQTTKQLISLGIHVGFPAQTINGVPLSDDAYKEYIQVRGQYAKPVLDQMTSDAGWLGMPKEWQQEQIRSALERARKEATNVTMQDHPEIIAASQAKKDAEIGVAP